MTELLELVDKQAQDEGLWFNAKYVTEAYLQAALRELHRLIETNPWISVEDRLPIDYKSVCKYETVEVLIVSDGIVGRCEFQCGHAPKPWYDFDGFRNRNVTYWQPFPEPPEMQDNA